jgi:hypothetical protein
MKTILAKLKSIEFTPKHAPLILLAVCVLAYGLLFTQLGFYWDEYVMTWIYFKLGPDALTQYFATNRPYWNLIYQFTLPLVGPAPWKWQLLALALRWIASLLVYRIVRVTWPKAAPAALWTALFFAVYPGFGEHFIALMYSHFYIVLDFFLLSIYLSLLAIRKPKYFRPLTLAALIFSFANLLTMEYFFFLEFARAIFIWFAWDDPTAPLRARVKRTALTSLPYLALVVGMGLWRAFFFKFQTTNYKFILLDQLRANPPAGLWTLIEQIALSLWTTVLAAWGQLFAPTFLIGAGARTLILWAGVVLVTLAGTGWFLSKLKAEDQDQKTGIQLIVAGLAACLFAGWPFWLTGLEIKLAYNGDRFTLPFILGASLILSGVIALVPRPKVRVALISLIVALAAGMQARTASTYVRDWDYQQAFFWQMQWRIPALKPGTTIVVNDLPVTYFSDNTLTAPLNWIYAPDNHSDRMSYMLYFASVRIGRGLPAFEKDLPIEQDYLAASFSGNTSQMIAIHYAPPGCLRVLDPQIDPFNKLLDPTLRDAAKLSDPGLIQEQPASRLPENLFASEPGHNWCFYFEQAELARGDWDRIAQIGRQAFALDDQPNDPLERFIFIEAYAHTGNWDAALQQTQEAYRFSKEIMRPLLCRLWDRIARETTAHPEQVNQARLAIQCKP